jgi:hypothetical protein
MDDLVLKCGWVAVAVAVAVAGWQCEKWQWL